MPSYAYRILNVFAETTFGGNPLAVFEDARGLDEQTMQALAKQFNLSETTFILPSEKADARVRIFTPDFELPFAGHPTLGTAHVVAQQLARDDRVVLEMKAGLIPVIGSDARWTLRANQPSTRKAESSNATIAAALGLHERDLAADPLWVDTGTEQLVVPLVDASAVQRCQPVGELLDRHCSNGERAMAYVWTRTENDGVLARFFFPKQGSLCEDPGTGSACANLGGYLLATGHAGPLQLNIEQGAQIGRPCLLTLRLEENGDICVGGRVIEIGRGHIEL